jgi:predicted lipid-binding transport protein (Tim44 family)
LQKLVLKQADQALNQAMSPLYSMVGGLGESLLGGLTSGLLGGLSAGGVSAGVGASANIFNVNVAAQDAASFRGSETQIAASLSRAVSRGTRGL